MSICFKNSHTCGNIVGNRQSSKRRYTDKGWAISNIQLSSIDTIVFDKTGTLTTGKPEVTDIIPNDGYKEFELLQLASSTEIKSEHPIAQAIVKKASEQSIPTLKVSDFNSYIYHEFAEDIFLLNVSA